MIKNICRSLKAISATFLVCIATTVASQPARIVVPFAPGGTSDIFARILAEKMSESIGNAVIIENRAGASGMIGLDYVLRASESPPTLGLLTTSTLFFVLAQRPELAQDFKMVSLLGIGSMVIVSNRDVTVADLVKRSRQGQQIRFGSAGNGSLSHLCFEQFATRSGLQGQPIHIAYKGSGPLLVDLIAGQQIDSACVDLPVSIPHIKSGKLRALAVTMSDSNGLLPGVPTLEEAGVQGVVSGAWFALYAPKSMSRTTMNSMVTAVTYALSDSQVQTRLRALNLDPIPAQGTGPEIADQFIQRQIARLRPYVSLIKQ